MKKVFQYTITAVFSFLLLGSFAIAQKGIVNGTVQGPYGSLQAAMVATGDVTGLTDTAGRFFLSLDAGRHTLMVTHAGYKKVARDIIITPGNTQTIDFVLTLLEALGEVVVLGSRSAVQRSNLHTPVPVDVFSSDRLLQTGQLSLTQMLNATAPSFNASRELLNEPVTLRGLDPQHVLILLNGVRYHNMAWYYAGGLRGQLGRGSVGNDLNSIPFSAVDKIEILRDGAAAQYGSDAVAGVINIRLEQTTGKTAVRLHMGQYYKDDGEKISFGFNRGFAVNKKGFLNFSADFRYQEPTFRGGVYEGTVYRNYPAGATRSDSMRIKAQDDSIIQARGFNRYSVTDNVGSLKIVSGGLLINAGYNLTQRTELFLTATINERNVWRDAIYRYPKNTNQVNLALYPNGFQAIAMPNTTDASAIAGIKGRTKNDWHWDIAGSYGLNSLRSSSKNNNNPSQSYLGKAAQTSFYTGKQVYQLLTHNINVTRQYTPPGGNIKSLNVATGAEWRVENYRTKAGEEASWQNYDTTGRTQAGAGGIHPKDVFDKYRNVLGVYFDVETETNDRFLFDAAVRYEYYNDFGGNLAGKLAVRYKLSERFLLRASVNNGFRAPSLQQRYSASTSYAFTRVGNTVLAPAVSGLFPNDAAVTKALGIPSLRAERTLNASGGLTVKPADGISLTADVYWIQIKNRIILSNQYNRRTNKGLDSVLSRYPDLKDIDAVSFFSNAINTRTYGLDVVLNGYYRFPKASLRYILAANLNRTHIFGRVQVPDSLPKNTVNSNILFSRVDKGSLEKGQPQDKLVFSLHYQKGQIGVMLTNTRYGRTIVMHENTAALDEFFSPKILTDVSFQYKPKSRVTLILGVNNVFDVYPDRLQHYENTNQGLLIYSPEASPFGFNGGYYFANVALNF